MKIGLCACFDTFNYGSELQSFATIQILKEFSNDIELIKSLCNDFNPKEILTMEDARKLDIFGHHIPSSFNDAVRMYNIQEAYYGYGRK